MINHAKIETAWLYVKVSAFTLLVPVVVVVLAPHVLLADASLMGIDVYGTSLLGALPIVLGAALYFRSAYDFVQSGRGTPALIDPPVRLVIEGPYRYSRNPMYIAVLAILAGEALLYHNLSLLYFAFALALGFHLFILCYEERALRRQFGEAYLRYQAVVPRWVPTWSGIKALYRKSFLKVGAYVFAGGVVVHIFRLAADLLVPPMPVSAHAFLVVLPAYTVFGSIIYWRQINLAGIMRKIIFVLIIALLLLTLVMHAYSIVAHDNRWLGIFPMWYSILAAMVYGGFAHFLVTRTLAGD